MYAGCVCDCDRQSNEEEEEQKEEDWCIHVNKDSCSDSCSSSGDAGLDWRECVRGRRLLKSCCVSKRIV